MKWQSVLDFHKQVAGSLAEAAERIPVEKWLTPREEGKWTPAEILEHLNLTYDTLLREIKGGSGMAIITKPWQRILLRLTVMRRILRGGGFPAGVRAPRELRPAQVPPDKDAAIAAFRDRAKRFDLAAVAAHAAGNVKLSHAFFGKGSIPDSVLLCARHMEHHLPQLNELR